MNKLEQLKALMTSERDLALSWLSSANSEASDSVVKPTWGKFRDAKLARRLLSDELLPHLIAVAEAAEKVDCTLNDRTLENMRYLQMALLPLIKDTDK